MKENNSKKPAFPLSEVHPHSGCLTTIESGLTKREYFVGLAMQGLLSGRSEYEDRMIDVSKAVELADLLLKELEK